MKVFRKLLPFVCAFVLTVGTVPVVQALDYQEDTMTLADHVVALWEELESYAGEHEFTDGETEALSEGANRTLTTLRYFNPFADVLFISDGADAKELIECGLEYARGLLAEAEKKGQDMESVDRRDLQDLSKKMDEIFVRAAGSEPADTLAGSLYAAEVPAGRNPWIAALVFCAAFAAGMVLLYVIHRSKDARGRKEEAK